jgi:hypothetical protein
MAYQHLHVQAIATRSYPDLPLYSDGKLLVEPYRNRSLLLKELEDEVDGRQKDFAPSTATASHYVVSLECLRWMELRCETSGSCKIGVEDENWPKTEFPARNLHEAPSPPQATIWISKIFTKSHIFTLSTGLTGT